jgi:plastocyanin
VGTRIVPSSEAVRPSRFAANQVQSHESEDFMVSAVDTEMKTIIIRITQSIRILIMRLPGLLAVLATGILSAAAVAALAQEEYLIVIKEHRMSPADLQVSAGQKIKLVIHNQDATPEEFESHILNREKIIPGNSKGTVFIGPLKPGTYEYFGDFNQATAQGTITAK